MLGDLKNVEVNAGEPIRLFGEFIGSPYPTAKWIKKISTPAKKTTELQPDKKISISSNNKNTELVIDPSMRTDKGSYVLQLSNFLKTIELECQVDVLGESTSLSFFLLNHNLKISTMQNAVCFEDSPNLQNFQKELKLIAKN